MVRESAVDQLLIDRIDARIARVASGQWSIIDIGELRACGLSRQAVWKRVQAGRLFVRHRGVFAVGHDNVPLEGVFLAAVKACGWGAVLSHYSAAVLWEFLPWDFRHPEVTAPTLRRRPGIQTHRAEDIKRVYRKGIPVTTPLRTLIDLAGSTLPDTPLRRAVNEALNRGLIKPHEIILSGHRGARRLRALLADAAPTRNEFEDAVHALLNGLPKADVNQREGRYFPDFRWPEQRLILEADGERFHGHILARADDKARQAVLEADGWRVERTTWKQLVREPAKLRSRMEEALAARASILSTSG